MKKKINFFLIIILIVVLDQVSKFWILSHLDYGQRINIISGFFDLTLLFNKGAAFSFLATASGWQHYVIIALAFLVCGYFIYQVISDRFNMFQSVTAAFIIGGALGNVIDRFSHGHVVDFLLFYYNNYYYPAFNFADSFIFIGAFFLILDGFLGKKR